MLTIQYSPQDDLKNWLRLQRVDGACFQFTQDYPFQRDIPLIIENQDQLIKSLNLEVLAHYQSTAKLIEKTWTEREVGELSKIAAYLNIPTIQINAKASLTTAYKMPYDYKFEWFMIQACKPLEWQMNNIVHEIFHICQLRQDPDMLQSRREREVERYLEYRSKQV